MAPRISGVRNCRPMDPRDKPWDDKTGEIETTWEVMR